jgi:hypothetical protein
VADVDIPITAGSGTNIRAFQKAGGDYDQYVREARGTALGTLANIPWTVTTAGTTSVIAADVTRVGLLVISGANGIVYVNFGASAPTALNFDWILNPGDRWEVPIQFCQFAQSWVGAAAGGLMQASSATCA